jgi:hypothetical protein
LTASGPNPLSLSTTLTNEEITDLGGTGSIILSATSGAIDNLAGTLTLSQSVVGMVLPGTSTGVFNEPLGMLDISSPSTPVTISEPFTNDGSLSVAAGSSLVLSSPTSSGTPTINLNAGIELQGNLYLYSTATSSSGFTLGGPGYFEVGGGTAGTIGTLNVPTGVSDQVQGNMEITSGSLLTGGGTVYNSGL